MINKYFKYGEKKLKEKIRNGEDDIDLSSDDEKTPSLGDESANS